MRIFLFAFLLYGIDAYAFIPPLASLLKEISDSRRPAAAIEVVLRHRFIRSSEPFELEERLIRERGRTYVQWKSANPPQNTLAILERDTYTFSKDKSMAAKSSLLVKYFMPLGYDELKDELLAEQFVHRDQFLQFKPGFTPEGDPQFWGLKENYFRHDDIFLHRLPQGVAIAVVGLDQGGIRREVFLDRSLRGLLRLEWREDPKREGPKTFGWNFDQFTKFATGEVYPKRLSFEVEGVEVITSELAGWRVLPPKALAEAKNNWKQAARTSTLSSIMEKNLQLLLSYR